MFWEECHKVKVPHLLSVMPELQQGFAPKLNHLFMRIIICFLCVFSFFKVSGQQKNEISGKILETTKYGDSIFFFSEFDMKDCCPIKELSSSIQNNAFLIKEKPKYPQMFRMRLKSEKDIIPYRNGYYFLDSSSTTIIIEGGKSNSKVIGQSGNEFNNIFIPFFTAQGISEAKFEYFLMREKEKIDPILLSYVEQNPNSYVALWFLICRFNYQGYSDVRNRILESFSTSLKESKLWLSIHKEFNAITIKNNILFPEWALKNMQLKSKLLKVPKNKFVLIDFWFARCRPCLDQIPELKDIYEKYKDNLSILSISIDKTKDVPILKDRIKEYQIPWENYLDENGINAAREKIFSFPTNFLLDKEGRVIRKDISFQELKIILNSIVFDSPIRSLMKKSEPL